jgi:hypothetical protein
MACSTCNTSLTKEELPGATDAVAQVGVAITLWQCDAVLQFICLLSVSIIRSAPLLLLMTQVSCFFASLQCWVQGYALGKGPVLFCFSIKGLRHLSCC